MSHEITSKSHSDVHDKQEKKIDHLEDLMLQLINQNLALSKRMDEQGRRFDEQGRRHDDLMEKLGVVTQQINTIWSNLDDRLSKLDDRLSNLETKILNRLPPKTMTT